LASPDVAPRLDTWTTTKSHPACSAARASADEPVCHAARAPSRIASNEVWIRIGPEEFHDVGVSHRGHGCPESRRTQWKCDQLLDRLGQQPHQDEPEAHRPGHYGDDLTQRAGQDLSRVEGQTHGPHRNTLSPVGSAGVLPPRSPASSARR
jgi:hypothetical protein